MGRVGGRLEAGAPHASRAPPRRLPRQADVYVLESHRGRGLAAWLLSCILSDPELEGLRRWSLVTRDAHGPYRRFGFTALQAPERHMEIVRPDIYKPDIYKNDR